MNVSQKIKALDMGAAMDLWNDFIQSEQGSEKGYSEDDYVWEDVEMFQEYAQCEPVALAQKVFFGDIRNWCEPVQLDGYANLRTWYLGDTEVRLLTEWVESEELEEEYDLC